MTSRELPEDLGERVLRSVDLSMPTYALLDGKLLLALMGRQILSGSLALVWFHPVDPAVWENVRPVLRLLRRAVQAVRGERRLLASIVVGDQRTRRLCYALGFTDTQDPELLIL